MSALARRLRAWAERDGRGYPDWAMRYAPIVRRLRARGALHGRILEIGANANGLARFARVPVIAIDIAADHLREARAAQPVAPCQAGIAALPFADAAFDAVVCIDTFEHLPGPARAAAARELLRVLAPRGAAAVAFPSGAAAARAERRVQAACRRHTGRTLRWLDEHAAVGLPEADAMRGLFAEAAGPARRIAVERNANLIVWSWMWRVLMCGWPGRGNAAAQALLRALTPLLERAHFGACYRTVLWILPEGPTR